MGHQRVQLVFQAPQHFSCENDFNTKYNQSHLSEREAKKERNAFNHYIVGTYDAHRCSFYNH